MAQAQAIDHRIGVGQRADQQGQYGIDDEEGQDREQKRDPDAGEPAPAPSLNAALRDLDAPVSSLSVANAFPLPTELTLSL